MGIACSSDKRKVQDKNRRNSFTSPLNIKKFIHVESDHEIGKLLITFKIS